VKKGHQGRQGTVFRLLMLLAVIQKNKSIMFEITGKPSAVKKKMNSDFCEHKKKATTYV